MVQVPVALAAHLTFASRRRLCLPGHITQNVPRRMQEQEQLQAKQRQARLLNPPCLTPTLLPSTLLCEVLLRKPRPRGRVPFVSHPTPPYTPIHPCPGWESVLPAPRATLRSHPRRPGSPAPFRSPGGHSLKTRRMPRYCASSRQRRVGRVKLTKPKLAGVPVIC